MKQIPSLPRLLSSAVVFSALSLGALVLAPSSHAATVTVRPGDTLSKLFPSSWAHVCRINGLANCDRIYVGQRLNDGNGGVVLASAQAPVHHVQATTAAAPGLNVALATKYVWGGTTPYVGFDCSGMTQWLAAQRGISIPRTSQGQAAGLRAISRAELLPGDIVVMNNGTAAGHVGTYIGDGKMIHALNARQGIVIESLDYTFRWLPLYGYRAVGH